MALIICKECGKEYSNKASGCPGCGCPTSFNVHPDAEDDSTIGGTTADIGRIDSSTEDGFIRKKSKITLSKKGKILALLAMVLLVGILAAVIYANSSANLKRKLIGTWRLESVGGEKAGINAVTIEFSEDGSYSCLLNGELTDSQWKLEKDKKLLIPLSSGATRVYEWGDEDPGMNEWHVENGILRTGNAEFRRTDERSSKAKKDIEVINELMESAEKTAQTMNYGESGLCFEIRFFDEKCDISVTNASFPDTCVNEWKKNAGFDGEYELQSSAFHIIGRNPTIVGIIDADKSVRWRIREVTVPISLKKWFE